MSYVCAECGKEHHQMNGTCDKCGSFRIVLITVVEELFGKDWRKCFSDKDDENANEK